MEHNLLSADELAKALNVPKSWIYSRTRETGSNSIPKLMVGKYIRFRLPDVMDWLEQQTKPNEGS